MIALYTLIPLFILIFLFFKLYYAPRREIKRFTELAKDLGYKVYEEKFSFLYGSFLVSMDKGK